jgi:hypothetical protein
MGDIAKVIALDDIRASQKHWRNGRHGRPTGAKPFSAPPRLWRAATACCRNCITISAAYQNDGTKCGQYCTTSTAMRRMVRHQPRAFSGDRSRTSSKPCYLRSRPCLNHGGENAKLPYVIEVTGCPALSGYPAGTGIRLMGCKSPDLNCPFGGLAGGHVCGVIRRRKDLERRMQSSGP